MGDDWYCPKCERFVGPASVTFEETHDICGTPVLGASPFERIAELEEENKRLRRHQDWLRDETLVLQLRTINKQASLWKDERKRADEAEAELETLKARRCGGCKHWHGHNYCAEGIAEECDVPELPDHDFACNRWTPKEADHEA